MMLVKGKSILLKNIILVVTAFGAKNCGSGVPTIQLAVVLACRR